MKISAVNKVKKKFNDQIELCKLREEFTELFKLFIISILYLIFYK